MSEKLVETANQQSRQERHNYRHNQQRNYNNRQYQQHSYQQDQQQQQRRYSNSCHNASLNKIQIKVKAEESLSSNKETEISKCSKQASTIGSFSHTNTNCVCCLHQLTTYVTYPCMHYICLHCAVKLRIICQKLECPICRQVSEKVICSKETLSTSSPIAAATAESDTFLKLSKESEKTKRPLNGGFYYDLSRIKHEYEELLSNRCKLCKERHFSTFDELDQHMKRTHQMFYCEFCTLNLDLFTFERKFYNRQLLAQHMREGDSDDQSFKGHPNCSYCNERFFDRDELYRHLRKDHFYCHFCDADGHEEYYENCLELRKHFKISHYLCEIDDFASNNDTLEYSVFRTEIDFNAHKKLKHAKTKSEAKNYGKINIEFNISNPIRDRIRDSQRGGGANQEKQRQQKQNLREMYERYDDSNSNATSISSNQPQQVVTPVFRRTNSSSSTIYYHQ